LSCPPIADQIWNEIGATAQNTFSLIDPEDHVAGFGQILPRQNGTAHLARIIVSPVLRGHGIGRILCQGLIRIGSRSGGATRFTLRVYKENLPAVNLYRSLGFIVIAEDAEQNWFRMLLEIHLLPAS
jgi:ribosomal protein S18 acetylase RimI-like enzyme